MKKKTKLAEISDQYSSSSELNALDLDVMNFRISKDKSKFKQNKHARRLDNGTGCQFFK